MATIMGSHYLTVLAAIILLSALVLNVNRSILYSSECCYSSEAISTAACVGQELIDEISSKAFDENTISNYIEELSLFTAYDSLSNESGEVYPNFDDVDDFNGYSRIDFTPRLGDFTTAVTVCYVNPNSPNTVVNAKTRMKKFSVSVSSDLLVGNLEISGFISY